MKKKLSSGKRPCYVQGIGYCFPFLFSVLLSISLQGQIHLVKDINQNAELNNYEFDLLTDVNGILFFRSDQKALWRSDGTTSGSVKLKDFISLSQMKNVNGLLFFFASDDAYNTSLWKSDGTVSGTEIIKPSLTGSSMTVVNNLLYFVGNGSGKGSEVWRSDGTPGGTYLVKDIMKGAGSSNPTSLVSFNNKLFFVANNGVNGYEVWQSDGSPEGTQVVKDIIPGKTSSAPNFLTVADNTLYFMARDAALGQEIWKSDGTPEGTVLVSDVRPGSASSFPTDFIAVNDKFFFRANDGVHGFELWTSDGTAEGTMMVKDISPGKNSGFSWINGMIAVNDNLYFILGRDVYITDGTPGGTQVIVSIEDFYNQKEMAILNGSLYIVSSDYYVNDLYKIDGSTSSIVATISSFESGGGIYSYLTQSGNYLYFQANGGNDQVLSLWKSDGTAEGTAQVLDILHSTAGSSPSGLTDVNGLLYFTAYDGSASGLWKSDGTEDGTQKISDVYASDMISYNGTLIFTSYTQLYKSDGTNAGTVPVNSDFLYPRNLTLSDGKLYFMGDSYPLGYELWRTNGTAAGTVQVKDIFPGRNSSYPENLTDVNGMLYFTANDGVTGTELWKSDGTTAGTMRVKDLNASSNVSSLIESLVPVNGILYFKAYTQAQGQELWKSDGTESGTLTVKDINSNDQGNDIGDLIAMNGTLYFVASDAASGWALWKTDGTSAGTVKVKDFYPGLETIRLVQVYHGELYILVSDPGFGNHALWKSDGTEAGTVQLKWMGVESNGISSSLIYNDILYINAFNRVNQSAGMTSELWRTDGTSCGTYKINYPYELYYMTESGSDLFFSGYFNATGYELVRLEESDIVPPACEPMAARNALTGVLTYDNERKTDGIISHYPNPFNGSFTLSVKGNENEKYTMHTLQVNGVEVETKTDLKCNADYLIGSNWQPGLYLVRIHKGSTIVTKKVMKIY